MHRLIGCCVLLILALGAQVIESQEYNYTVVNSTDSEDKVVITDSEGNVVSTVIAFPNEGFEVILPSDNNECYIKEIDDDSPCYQDLPVTEPLPSEVIAICVGRETRNLVPADCAGEDGAVGDRKKRRAISTCCRWTKHVTTTCSSRYCCKKFLGICTKRCCNYSTKVSYTKQCVRGLE